MCEALGVSRGGFYAWLTRPPSRRSRRNEDLADRVRTSFLQSDRTYWARRVWHDLLAAGSSCGLHRIERLMRLQGFRARPRRRRLPPDIGERSPTAVSSNVLDRQFAAERPNQKWIADFTYVWTAEGWLYVAAVIDLFSRRVVGWSMSAGMTAQLVTDALVMAIWRRGKPDALRRRTSAARTPPSHQAEGLLQEAPLVEDSRPPSRRSLFQASEEWPSRSVARRLNSASASSRHMTSSRAVVRSRRPSNEFE